jgi:hypothetical protein
MADAGTTLDWAWVYNEVKYFQLSRQKLDYSLCHIRSLSQNNESDFFCAAQKAEERQAVVEAGGGRTQLYSLTCISRVCAFVAVGTLAKRKIVSVWSRQESGAALRN